MSCDSKYLSPVGTWWDDDFGGTIYFVKMIEFCGGVFEPSAEIKISTPWGESETITLYESSHFIKSYTKDNKKYDVDIFLFCGMETTGVQAKTCYEDIPQTGSINCSPTTAPISSTQPQIFLDGNNTMLYAPHVFTGISPGSHRIDYYLTGYKSCGVDVTVTAGQTAQASCTLERATGILNCMSTPTEARITIGTTNYGLTNRNIDLYVGDYIVKFSKEGYEDYTDTKTILADRTTYMSKTLIEKTAGINCTSEPPGSQIFLDGNNTMQYTPHHLINILPGNHNVEYFKTGYNPCEVNVHVPASETVTAFCKLDLIKTGTLRSDKDSYNPNLEETIIIEWSNVNFDGIVGIRSPTSLMKSKVIFSQSGDFSYKLRDDDEIGTWSAILLFGVTEIDKIEFYVGVQPTPGFDINVNIPGLPPNQDLRLSEVIKIPLTDIWYNPPLVSGLYWNNISNDKFKARELKEDCRPIPAAFQGLVQGKHYAIYAGDPVVAFHPQERIFELTSTTTDISITNLAALPTYLSKLCSLLDVPEIECATSFYTAIPDVLFSAEDLSIIIDGKSIYPPYDAKDPTPWNYLWVLLTFTPIGIIQKVSKPATAIIKSAKLDPKLADILTEMNFGQRVTFMSEDQLNLISTLAEELRYDDIRTLLWSIPQKPANIDDYKKWMASLKDIIGDKKAVKNMDIGVKGAPTTIKHADALLDMATDYSNDAGNLLEYFRTSKLDNVVDLANDIEANPTIYTKLIGGSEVIDPYKYGISLKNLYHIDALLTPGNVAKLQDAGKLDGFAHDLFMAMQDTPDIYRELMKHIPDSDVNRLSDELISTGHRGLASIYKGLKSVTNAESTGGLFSGLDAVGKTLAGAADEGGDASKAARSVLDNAVDVIPTNTADDAAALAFEATDDALRMPALQRFWTWVKDTAADTGKLWSSMTLAEKAKWYAKYIFTVGCFGLFIAEETIQWVGFGSIPLWNLVNRWDSKTVEQRQSVISDLKWFLDARRKMHDTIGLTLVPLTIACPFMAPLYYKFHQADSVNIEAYSRTIEYLEKDINPLTGLGICRIPIKSNLSGVDVYIDGLPTGKKAYPYVQYIENVPVKETEYDIAIVGTKSGYLPDTQMITIYPTDIGKTTGDIFLELQPKSILEETDPLPDQDPADNSTLPEPYGPIDPDIWWSGDVGDVWCTSDPPYAEVWVGTDKYPGVTPLKIESLEAGDYTLVYKKEDYTDCQDDVKIIAGKQIESFCKLEFKCSNPSPSISITPSEPVTGELVKFEGSVANADPGIMKNWEWDVAGVKKTGQDVTHTFTTDGTKAVKLTVINECDTPFTTSRTVYVSKPDIIGYINCYCSGDYCGEGISILLDGEDTGQKTTNKPFYTVVQATAGTHTIEYNYKDIMKCGDTVTVVAGEDVSIDCTPVGVLDPTQTGVQTIITEIIDGDTIRTKYTDDIIDSPSVRMVGYDAAESGTVQGIEATKLLTSYIPVGTPITLKIWKYSPLGFYGRVLGGVLKGGMDINLEMLRSCIVELSSYRDKFYWVDWDLYENQYCDNELFGNLTVKTYSSPNEPMTGVTVYVDGLDKGNAPVTIKSLSIGSHSIRLEKTGYKECSYCENVGCTPGNPISDCDFSVNIDASITKVLEVTMQVLTLEDAIWEIGYVTDQAGNILSAAKVYVDDTYIGHYAPETLKFCTGCTCDTIVPCGFGEHTITVKKTGYRDWSNTRTLSTGDSFTDNPIMEPVFEIEIDSLPDGAIITVDGEVKTTSLNLIQQLLLEQK